MKRVFTTFLFCLSIGFVFGQDANGDYRTAATGNWNQVAAWQVYNDGWFALNNSAAGPYQNIIPTSSSGQITVRHNITITQNVNLNQVVVESPATLRINSARTVRLVEDNINTPLQVDAGASLVNVGTLDLQTLLSSTPCQISGELYSANLSVIQISNPSLLLFNSGGMYRHVHNSGGAIPLATWDANSTCIINGLGKYSAPAVPANLDQAFGNFEWNTPSLGSSTSFSLAGALTTINGSLILRSTNNRPVRFSSVMPGYNLTVAGDVIIQTGTYWFTANQSSASTITIGGDFIMQSGNVVLGTYNNSALDIFLNGNFQKTGGNISRGQGNGLATFRFAGDSPQTYSNAQNITSAVNFSVETGSTLDLGANQSTNSLTGTGRFTLNAGADLILRSTAAAGALQLGNNLGNIRTTGVRTYQSGSTIHYSGPGTQGIGSGHPSNVDTNIENLDVVYLVANATINGKLSLVAGPLVLSNYTLTIGGDLERIDGYIGIIPTSNLIVNGTGDIEDLHLAPSLPAPDNSMNNLTINRAGLVRLTYDLIVGGNLNLTNGTLLLGQPFAFELTLRGNVTRTAGTLAIDFDPNLTIEGSGTLPANFPIILHTPGAKIDVLTMDRPGRTFSTDAVLNLNRINLFNGTVNNLSSNLTMTDNGLVVRRSGGSINQVLSAETTYDVVYEVAADINTGNELPDIATHLGDLTKMGTATVTLVKDIAVNGNLTIDEGTFDAGIDNDISISQDFVVNGTFVPQEGLVTFAGADQNILGTGSIVFYDFEINQPLASTVTLSTNADIENSLDINSPSTLQAGEDQLRLLSTPIKTANVYQVPDESIIGSVIVQRYLPKVVARRSFFYMASPVTGSGIPDWDVELPIKTVYRWNEPTRKYVGVAKTSSLLPGRGFAVDVNSTETFTFDIRGTLQIGNIGVPVTAQSPVVSSPDGYNLVGNPYPSAIDWDNIVRPVGVYNAMYITDNFGNSGQGDGLEISVSYVDGESVPEGYGGEIAQGQAFWIKATANTTLTFTEAAKILPTDDDTKFYRKGETPNVLRIKLDGLGVSDEALVRLREGATDGFDEQFDAFKFLKGELNLATLTSDNVKAVINAYGTSDCNKNIPIVAEGIKAGNYTFNFKGIESFDTHVNVSLIDQNEKKSIDLRQNPAYSFVVKDTSSFATRFQIAIIANSAPINVSISATGVRLCDDGSDAIITLDSSEPGVEYSVVWEGQNISEKISGTGAPVKLSVNTAQLPLGETKVNVQAESGICSSMSLTQMPIIEKVGKGEITSVKDGTICESGTTTLTASGSDANGWYNWYESEDATNPIQNQNSSALVTPNLNKSKTYYVSVVNALGCEGDRMAVKAIVSKKQEVELVADGSTLISNIDEGNRWYFNDTVIDGETSNSLTAIEPGIYTVKVGSGTCVSESSYEISATDEQGITIYPNPVAEKVFVKIRSKNKEVLVSIVNSQGVAVESKLLKGETEVKQGEFDLLPFAAGIYQLRFEDGRRIVTKKIVKLK